MTEAVVNFHDALKLLTPAFNEKTVRVVWDDQKAIVTVVEEGKRKLKAYGSLSNYADPMKIASEKDAWPEMAVMKHDNI